ncbi:ATP-binding protein [Paenibacillus sp. P96]|uniref:histidine kinase n=1 Tax=Paenibacillus zeirhizosphaerae TaxID=2987519 RepID=A0ABT9FNV4_9BACL|nr:ATP-binding protein [Paenibacillus sp. P96]MDP4096369.1 ATP-binding protein [Paenibacillus sp. P96]
MFTVKDHPRAIDGVIDLRGTDLEKSPPFYLNGEWKFYPESLTTGKELLEKGPDVMNIPVPADWGSALHPDTGNSIGYGTYRLRILIDPLEEPIAFWFRGVTTASEIEINGEMAGSIGKVATSKQEYAPKSVSFTASYDIKGTTEIDILVRVANFDNPNKGGFVNPVRFGSQASIDFARWYSIGLQIFIFLVLLLHEVYAFIIYAFNPKEKTLLITGLLLLVVSIVVLSNYDTILLNWFPMIHYTWAIKIKCISMLWQVPLMLLLFRRFMPTLFHKGWLRVFFAANIGFTVLLLIIPAAYVDGIVLSSLFYVLYFMSFAWFLYIIGMSIFKRQTDRDMIFLLLSSAGIISNFIWSTAEAVSDVTAVYYPIDLVIAIIGFSSYWFKQYFRQSRENIELNAKLREADQIKDQFLANTSHELRTPLHGILNIAHHVVAKEKDRLEKSSLDDMQLLITISRRMSHLLGDLLDVVRLKEHRLVLRKEPLQVQSIVPGIISMLQYMAEAKPVALHMDLPEAMPSVLADEKRLVQVFYNLLHNALKYTEEGAVSVSAEIKEGRVLIHIADTGIGMDEATRARVFLPYERGAFDVNDGQGIGLGLSISKQLIEQHGGTLTVHSEPGQGSVFSFDLPVADESNLSMQQTSSFAGQDLAGIDEPSAGFLLRDLTVGEREVSATMSPPLLEESRARILAVDDDPINLKVLASILSTEPYVIVTAQSGREALELLDTQQWDLLIADVMMPNMSGYELTRIVREQFPMSELPVLLLTARSQPADIYTGFSAGASDYVTKPVDALELKYRIRALVTLRQSVNERLRMEAAYLQAQIQPHFLFNTLNSLLALSEMDTDSMLKLGDAFASYLRISFNYLNTGRLVELSHELELVKSYLYIEKVRFGDRLSIEWEVEPDMHLQLPPLSIQPLVENAVNHGLLSQPEGGTVRISITRQNDYALIEVSDDGKGMDQEQVERLLNARVNEKNGIGIANTNRRLKQLYGQGLSIASHYGKGTTMSFEIPDKSRPFGLSDYENPQGY